MAEDFRYIQHTHISLQHIPPQPNSSPEPYPNDQKELPNHRRRTN